MLSTAMVFSLNTSIWAAEPGEEGAFGDGRRDGKGAAKSGRAHGMVR